MVTAYQYALAVSTTQPRVNEKVIKALAIRVTGKPHFKDYRCTPVTFSNGTVIGADTITTSMQRLVEHVPTTGDYDVVIEWIRAFLKIHPFEDGNGRIAFILQNWLLSSWNAPQPLHRFEW